MIDAFKSNRAAYAAYFGASQPVKPPAAASREPARPEPYSRRELIPPEPAPVYRLEGPVAMGSTVGEEYEMSREAVETLVRHLDLETRRGSQLPGEE